MEIGDDIEKLSSFDGRDALNLRNDSCFFDILAEIEYEAPNNNLGRFEGNIKWQDKTLPLKNDNILLRGTRLRNTQWAFGSKY